MAEAPNGLGEDSRLGKKVPSPYSEFLKAEGVPVTRARTSPTCTTSRLGPGPGPARRARTSSSPSRKRTTATSWRSRRAARPRCCTTFSRRRSSSSRAAAPRPSGRRASPSRPSSGSAAACSPRPSTATTSTSTWMASKPARFFGVTNAPMVINIFRNADFVFNDKYTFNDRYDAEDNYFTDPGTHVGSPPLEDQLRAGSAHFKLDDYHERGAGGVNMRFRLANNQMECHVSQFPPGTYKKGHKHGVGAHVLILSGVGYSLLWFKGEEPPKIDWKDGSVLSPKAMEYHQHFNTGPTPAAYLAMRLGCARPQRQRRGPRGRPTHQHDQRARRRLAGRLRGPGSWDPQLFERSAQARRHRHPPQAGLRNPLDIHSTSKRDLAPRSRRVPFLFNSTQYGGKELTAL